MSFSPPADIRFALSDIQLTSTAFDAGQSIPAKYTGEEEDTSPALSWKNVPEGTRSFAVFCHDPDAPVLSALGHYGFVHWVLYNIPGNVTELAEGCDTYTGGVNDFGNVSYNGPMPPNGHGQHCYYFWIVALDKELELEADLTMYKLLEKIQPHALGMNRLVGSYERD